MSAPVPPAAERARGYKPWEGERSAQGSRWWVIARGNLGVAWANRWVKAVLLLSAVPGIIGGGVVYFFIPLSPRILRDILGAAVVFVFLMGALVGARLVSEDRRQGAFIAHFARPVRRVDYLAGKALALALPMFVAATLSGLIAILADMSVDGDTLADRLGRAAGAVPGSEGYLTHVEPLDAMRMVVGFGLVAVACSTGLILGLSALTTRARTAGLVWFAVVALGGAAHGILQDATEDEWPALLSWSDALADMASTLTGRPDTHLEFVPWGRLALLVGLSLAGLAFVDWRLRRAEGGER